MKVTITGVSGFVGDNLSVFLKNKEVKVSALSLKETDWKTSFDRTSDAVIHLAGKAHDTKNTSKSEEYFQVNTELTKQLFNLFLESNIRDFFFFSSVKAVVDTVNGVLNEEEEAKPKTPYGQSKWLAEQYIQGRVLPEGKRVFIFRPCMIHGPGNKGNLNLLYKVVSRGIPWPLAIFENQRSFLSIENLQFVIKKILDNVAIPGGVYNLADDEAFSTNDLIMLISDVLERKPRLWKVPARFISEVAKVGDILHLPLNSERLGKLTESYIVSNHKIKTVLEINQLPLPAKEGLMRTLESFKNSEK